MGKHMEEVNKRAQRIHHKERLKAKRIKYMINYGRDKDDKFVKMSIDTPKPCNCWMCSKPKKHTASIAEIRETQPKLFEESNDE